MKTMKKKYAVIFVFCLFLLTAAFTTVYDEIRQEPNEPRKIVMPRNTKLPQRFKCPVHGIVDKAILTIEIDEKLNNYCKKCAMQFIVDVFDLNLPKLEQIKVAEAKDPNET